MPDVVLQLTCHRDLVAPRPSHRSPDAVSLSRPPLVVTVLPIHRQVSLMGDLPNIAHLKHSESIGYSVLKLSNV